MLRQPRLWLAGLVLGWIVLSASAQTPVQPAQTPQGSPPNAVPPPPGVATNAPASNAVAATVNGQPITELAVQRCLKRVEASKRAAARPEFIDFLVENVIIDQYLQQVPIKVDAAEVETRVTQMKEELKKDHKDFATFLSRVEVTEAELREQIAVDIRWDKFATAQATDKALQELFASHKEMFDGSTVRARHILLKADPDSPARLRKIKQNIEAAVAKGLAEKLPPNADALTREKERMALLDQAFVANTQESICPTKVQGGDIGSFGRAGFMVEPFAKVAFALKPYEMSDVVQTQFGYHLILVLEHKPGLDVKYEEVKGEVKEVFCDRLREAVLAQMKPRAKIVITPQPRP